MEIDVFEKKVVSRRVLGRSWVDLGGQKGSSWEAFGGQVGVGKGKEKRCEKRPRLGPLLATQIDPRSSQDAS